MGRRRPEKEREGTREGGRDMMSEEEIWRGEEGESQVTATLCH